MIHTSRRRYGARSLVVITTMALFGVVPALGPTHKARADGPVRPGAGRYIPPTHRLARPQGPAGPVHRPRRHVPPKTARVSIDTSAPGAPVLPGRVYNWPFVVKNQSTVRADAVTFAAPLPASLEFVSAQQNCSFAGSAAVCQLGSLKPGESKLGVVTAKVGEKALGGQQIGSDALVKWRSTPLQKEGQATAAFPQVRVADTADVSVQKGGPAMIWPGQQVPYQVTITNHGPTAARNVKLTSTSVPVLTQAASNCTSQSAQGPGNAAAGTGNVAAPGTGHAALGAGNAAAPGTGHAAPGAGNAAALGTGHGATQGTAQGLVCDIGTLQPGESRAIKINAQPRTQLKPGTVIQAPSQVSTSTIDTDLANNQTDTRTKVAAPAPAPARAAPVERQSAPGGMTGLPSTGAPITELLHLVVMLLGMGLIFYRLGRTRPRYR